MSSHARGRALPALLLLPLAVAVGAGNLALVALLRDLPLTPDSLQEAWASCPACVAFLALAPLALIGIALLFTGGSTAAAPQKAATVPTAPAAPVDDPGPALQLLALLQQEGRLIDFLEEDLTPYDDAQVGAAVRSIHSGCRQALRERLELERVLPTPEGDPVTVEPGFDPAEIRLTGNLAGEPPFRGTLQHGGWKVKRVNLPTGASAEASRILAPAEVEIA